MHKNLHHGRSFRAPILALVALLTAAPADAQDRRVALTYDDLPMTLVNGGCDPEVAREVTAKLVAGLERADAHATGMVNASRTCGLAPDRLRDPMLERWLDAGHDLGNHTWSHPDLEHTPLPAFLEDARKGGAVVDSLLAERGRRLVWFRHPMLHAGDTPEKKTGLARFLEAREWRVAPVTIDNQEYVYAYVYEMARRRGDEATARRAAEGFLDHLDEAFAYFEHRSTEVVGREIPHVLLLHANRLNADLVDEVIARIRARGYAIVPLAEVMEDPVYRRDDPWLGEGGPSWIERWAVEDGGEAREGPRESAWASETYHRLRASSDR